MELNRSDLHVTEGSVAVTRSGYFKIRGPKERAVRLRCQDDSISIRFRYLCPSVQKGPFGSGKIVTQIGLKLRAQNTCNVLYVMWRIEPTEYLLVTIKRNSKSTTHAECGNRGYHNIAEVSLDDLAITARTHLTQRLTASLSAAAEGVRCLVSIGDREVWSGLVPPESISDLDGPTGFRADNGEFIFKLFVPPY